MADPWLPSMRIELSFWIENRPFIYRNRKIYEQFVFFLEKIVFAICKMYNPGHLFLEKIGFHVSERDFRSFFSFMFAYTLTNLNSDYSKKHVLLSFKPLEKKSFRSVIIVNNFI